MKICYSLDMKKTGRKPNPHQLFFVLIALSLLLTSAIVVNSETAPSFSMAIHAVNGRFVDEAGRQVILRGVNAGGRSKIPPFFPFDPKPNFDAALTRYANGIKSFGFNVVRLLIIYEAAEPVRGRYDEIYLANYDKMIKAFGERGIRVIVDAHQDIFSRRLCGDGFPDWALPEEYRNLAPHADCKYWSLQYFKEPVSKSFDRFWSNTDGIQDSYVAFFKMLAQRYKNEPAVIGFEPINEPMPGKQGRDKYEEWHLKLYSLYEKVGAAAHSVDSRYMIFADICAIENTATRNTNRPRPKVENLALAPHYYDPGTFGLSIGKGGDTWLMQRGLGKHAALAKNWNVPVIVTEFGISPTFQESPIYIEKIYSVFDEMQLSGTFWEASMSKDIWNMENTSIFEPDGRVRPNAIALNRPYPLAVAGTIKTFSYDPQTKRIRLAWSEASGIAAPTEIYLPKILFFGTPKTNLAAGDKFDFNRNTGVFSIYPLGEKKEREIVLSP